ncbi:MAG TPA: PLP-dependent aminotransferase family protein [Gaiellaceae bacterium]
MPPPISFARGAPSPECLDPVLIADCIHVALERDGRTILAYGTGGGYGPLREVLAERHGVEPGRVFLTSGGLHGFAHYAPVQLQRRPGRVLVEAPTYDRPLKLLGWEGAEVVALPMDEEGLDPDALERELDRGGDVSFLYTIPTFQNPSGRTLSVERRRRLVALAVERGLDVLEDDPYGLVRYEGESPPSLHALEGGERVTFTSSFSKTVAPGLRVGYFVLAEGLVGAFDDRVVSTTISPPLVSQAAVHEVIARGAFEPNLERIRALLRNRRDTMLEALERLELPGDASWSRPQGGYFLWLELGPRVDSADLLRRANAAGVTFVKGADFFPNGAGGRSAARLAFSYETPERIAEGMAILAGLV